MIIVIRQDISWLNQNYQSCFCLQHNAFCFFSRSGVPVIYSLGQVPSLSSFKIKQSISWTQQICRPLSCAHFSNWKVWTWSWGFLSSCFFRSIQGKHWQCCFCLEPKLFYVIPTMQWDAAVPVIYSPGHWSSPELRFRNQSVNELNTAGIPSHRSVFLCLCSHWKKVHCTWTWSRGFCSSCFSSVKIKANTSSLKSLEMRPCKRNIMATRGTETQEITTMGIPMSKGCCQYWRKNANLWSCLFPRLFFHSSNSNNQIKRMFMQRKF